MYVNDQLFTSEKFLIEKLEAFGELVVLEGVLHSWFVTRRYVIVRDQLNSRFHGRDIFREIGSLP